MTDRTCKTCLMTQDGETCPAGIASGCMVRGAAADQRLHWHPRTVAAPLRSRYASDEAYQSARREWHEKASSASLETRSGQEATLAPPGWLRGS